MTKPWLHIIGIGEDGLSGLNAQCVALVKDAEIIFGGDRHHHLAADIKAERIAWPSPFDAMIDKILSYKGRKVVILVSGDPLWYSVGARIGRAIPPEEITYHPQVSAFQLAACRMGWSLPDVETVTIHGRPAEQIIPWFADKARLLILTKDGTSPQSVASLLCLHGYEHSRMSVLAAMGGEHEQRFDGIASEWVHDDTDRFPDLHTLAVELVAGLDTKNYPRTGLPDEAFHHDGNITKQAVRALTLAKLVPGRGELLWDVGIGCGSIAIEWMRAAFEARAIGIEPKDNRRAIAAQNALTLGTPALKLVEGKAPEALAGLARPDAVFVGGGVNRETVRICRDALKPGGRMVINAVTLESEAVLLRMFAEMGGDLQRIQIQTAGEMGAFHGWNSAKAVTQWTYVKPRNQVSENVAK
ncbi:MAG: precorrin-6y C5,15-methyltransferase (decarboxylating) subunit CbiE [Hyphomicrobiales bacterium]|nr:precorrin-6y C5,15-methyltransferase (decarboxylating) subunit CbiE [Hyphomicrobiales bacterium]